VSSWGNTVFYGSLEFSVKQYFFVLLGRFRYLICSSGQYFYIYQGIRWLKSVLHPKKKIGEILLEKGDINKEQLQTALDTQKTTWKRLGDILVDLGYLTRIIWPIR
jgi:hypothetical protein